jgi:hypothetical protein
MGIQHPSLSRILKMLVSLSSMTIELLYFKNLQLSHIATYIGQAN